MSLRYIVLFHIAILLFSSNAFACIGIFDPTCDIGKGIGRATQGVGKVLGKAVQDAGRAAEKAAQDVGKTISKRWVGLIPVRSYLKSEDIPPSDIGGYGILIFRSKPTDVTRARYNLICQSFIASFPRSETTSVPAHDQMVTIWPMDDPDAEEAKNDDCEYVLKHYDLNASELAIRDAHSQHAELDGEGPYLVGWSPSNSRGNPDKLVLVVDFSGDNSQSAINHKFLFWKNKIVQNPSLWRSGFSLEGIKIAIRDFADQYGQSMLDAIKLVGGK